MTRTGAGGPEERRPGRLAASARPAFVLITLAALTTPSLTLAVPALDLPPVGRSLFDQVFGQASVSTGEVTAPYPFDALLSVLDQYAGRDESGRSRLKRVLIPYGRSLQRRAAHPHYLASPRVLVTVDTGTAPIRGQPWFWLKDRLFIGYQPAAESLEVISYNQRAGRFEFQVVTDYAAGKRAAVRYASRRLCTACHQNEGPIFADESWDETHGNPELRAALRKANPSWPQEWLDDGTAHAAAFDNVTDRANLIPVYSLAWRTLCTASSLVKTLQCRSGALVAMLEQRMGPFAFFRPNGKLFRQHFHPRALLQWSRNWPEGLSIPNPNLANRRPGMLVDPNSIEPPLDPLQPRGELTRWTPPRGQIG